MSVNAADLITTERLPATYRQLHFWAERQYLYPEGGVMPGTGMPLKFDQREADIARLMAVLVDFGMKVSTAAKYARMLMESSEDTLIVQIGRDNTLSIRRPQRT